MVYRTFFGACVSTIIFAACSSDETTPAGGTPESGGSGGSMTGTGGRNTGGARTGGTTSTGGRATGGGGASTGGGGAGTGGGGASTGGAGTGGAGGTNPDAGDSSTGTGGTGTGGAGTGGAGTGGAGTGGTATDGGSCAALSACCATLSGREQTRCNNVVGSANGPRCTIAEAIYCGDGGTVGPGGGDAFVDCTALAACCSALPDGGRAEINCNRAVATANDVFCNNVSTRFCN